MLLLADEPTGNLDSKSALGIFDLIEQLHRERGMTVVLITHDDHLGLRADPHRADAGRPHEVRHSQERSGDAAAGRATSSGNGSVVSPISSVTPVPVSNLGNGVRPSTRPKSVLPPFAVQ